MKPSLVDVNVWVAWTVPRHSDHRAASSWFEAAGPADAGWNRFIHLGVMRLYGNPLVMGNAVMTASGAWRIIQDLNMDERVELVHEPASLEDDFPTLLSFPYPTNRLIADAYLAAVAIGSSRRLVTFDKGFKQFEGLDLLILGS